jgi:taurine dioxygenase
VAPNEIRHPVVPTHPVTHQKDSLFKPNFTISIVGLEPAIPHALLAPIAEAYQFQLRWKWSKDAVAIWDNRVTFYTGISHYFLHVRHESRTAAMAEKPVFESGKGNEAGRAGKGGAEIVGKDEAAFAG